MALVKESAAEYVLRNGDHMRQREFHEAYCQMPEKYRAELIAGVVFEPPSPISYSHASGHIDIGTLLRLYALRTPGVGCAGEGTVILSEEDEVQPDVFLRIEKRGKSKVNQRDFIQGAPELVAEVAHSSRAIDLHLKKDRYQKFGVTEYIVICVGSPKKFYWFDLVNNTAITQADERIIRSRIFPGLWIDHCAFMDGDLDNALKVLDQGIASKEHKTFVAKLAKR